MIFILDMTVLTWARTRAAHKGNTHLGDLFRVPHGLLVHLRLAGFALLAKQFDGDDANVKVGWKQVEPEDNSAFHRGPAVATFLKGRMDRDKCKCIVHAKLLEALEAYITTETNFGGVNEHMKLDAAGFAFHWLNRPHFVVERRENASKLGHPDAFHATVERQLD